MATNPFNYDSGFEDYEEGSLFIEDKFPDKLDYDYYNKDEDGLDYMNDLDD